MEKIKEPVIFTGERVPVQQEMTAQATHVFSCALNCLADAMKVHDVNVSEISKEQSVLIESRVLAGIRLHWMSINKHPERENEFASVIATETWDALEGLFV